MASSVAINVIPKYASVFPLQRAAELQTLSADGFTPSITLFRDGCTNWDPDDARHNNCSEACVVPSTMWLDPHTIHNCLAYRTVADLLATGAILGNGRQEVLDLGYLPDFNVTKIEDPVDQCLRSFCRSKADATANCAATFDDATSADALHDEAQVRIWLALYGRLEH